MSSHRVKIGVLCLSAILISQLLPFANMVESYDSLNMSYSSEIPGWYFSLMSAFSIPILIGFLLSLFMHFEMSSLLGFVGLLNLYFLAVTLSVVFSIAAIRGKAIPFWWATIYLISVASSFLPMSTLGGVAYPRLVGFWVWAAAASVILLMGIGDRVLAHFRLPRRR